MEKVRNMSMDHDTDELEFHPARWKALCASWAAQASRNCGCVHDIYQRLFSELVDEHLAKLSEEYHPAALDIAHAWDYLSPEGRAQAQQEMAEQGYCSHGLEPDCCPLGCGDLSWFEPEEH